MKNAFVILFFLCNVGFGQTILTDNNHITVTNKTLSGATNTFSNIPVNAIVGGSIDTSVINKSIRLSISPSGITRLNQTGYNAFAVPLWRGDTIHIITCKNNSTHVDKFNIVDNWSVDNGKTFTQTLLLTNADTSFRNPSAGIGPDGQFYILVSKYKITSAGNYGTWVAISCYRYDGNGGITLTKQSLPVNGNSFNSSYGNIVSKNDTMYSCVYGGSVNKVWLAKSHDGITWLVKSNVYSSSDDLSESSLQFISDSTLMVATRWNAHKPRIFLSHHNGESSTWVDLGEVYGGTSTTSVSPWVQIVDDTTVSMTFDDRSFYLVRANEYKIHYLDSAQDVSADSAGLIRRKVFYESILNIKNAVSNVSGAFGYTYFMKINNQWYIGQNDMATTETEPYTGADTVNVQQIFLPYCPSKAFARVYNSATQTYSGNATSKVVFNNQQMDNYGMFDDNGNLNIPHDGYYTVTFAQTFSNANANRKLLKVYATDPADSASSTLRTQFINFDINNTASATNQTINASSGRMLFLKGTVIKAFIQIVGANTVSSVSSQTITTGIFDNVVTISEE